jgi:hypothetical protein
MGTELTYDQRQYKLMTESLDLYLARKISLGTLIARLEGLVDVLEEPDPNWRRAFLRKMGVLEDVYAAMLDRQAEQLDVEGERLVAEATTALSELIQPMLEHHISVK